MTRFILQLQVYASKVKKRVLFIHCLINVVANTTNRMSVLLALSAFYAPCLHAHVI